MRVRPKDLSKEIENNIYYVMGAVDYCTYDKYVTRKARGRQSPRIYKLLVKYAREELQLDVVNHTYELDRGNTLGTYDDASEEIELAKAPQGSKIVTLVHEIAHALVGKAKYTESIEETIVETCAYVVLLTLGLKISDMSYPQGYGQDSKTIKSNFIAIRTISEQILEWVYSHRMEVYI